MKHLKLYEQFDENDPFGEEDWNRKLSLTYIYEVFSKYLLPLGKLLGSKSLNRMRLPDDLFIFNANIFADEYGKIWWGDLNLTKDKDNLIEISKELGIDLYILSEMDGRFGLENRIDFKEASMWDTINGLSEKMKKYFDENLLLKRNN